MRRSSLRIEELEPRCLLSATVFEHDGIGYFLDQDEPQIQRYDIANELWLAPIMLDDAANPPTVGHMTDQGLFVAEGRSVYRYNPDGSEQTHLIDTAHDVIAMHSDGNLLLLNMTTEDRPRFLSIDQTTHDPLGSFNGYGETVFGSSIAPDINRIFGRTQNLNPADITYVEYDDAGKFTAQRDSPYHGEYQRATRTWVFPDNARVVDSSGIIYSTDDLTYVNAFPGGIDEIDQLIFLGDRPIVLSGNVVTAYTPDVLPSGSFTLGGEPTQIFANDTSVIAFTPDPTQPTGFLTEIVPLADLAPPQPVAPIDPTSLAYTPDQVDVARDGTVLLLSRTHQQIFLWDPDERRYVDVIPLVDQPRYMAYAEASNQVFLAYDSGLIRSLDLDAAERAEWPFATVPEIPKGLAAAGPCVFAADTSGTSYSNFSFAPDGTLVDFLDFAEYSLEYVWSDVHQKMYHFRWANKLAWREINADGNTYPGVPPGGFGDYTWRLRDTPSGTPYPLRVAPDGSVVVLGTGAVHDAVTLVMQAVLPHRITDAAWIGDQLYTIHDDDGLARFEQWVGPEFVLGRAAQRRGEAHSLVALPGDRLLAVTINLRGIPVFSTLDQNLEFFDSSQQSLVGVHRNNKFLIDHNGNGRWDGIAGGDGIYKFGGLGDLPVTGDFNGDGFDEIGVYRKSNGKWYLDSNANGVWDPGADTVFRFGLPGIDDPVVGDWNGDGTDDIGIRRNRKFFLDANGSGRWEKEDGGDEIRHFGSLPGSPAIGDFNGDGRDDLGVHYDQQFFIDSNGNRQWDGAGARSDDIHLYNAPGDPAVGDWDSSGRSQLGTWHSRLWRQDFNDSGTWDRMGGGDRVYSFGLPTDTPIVGTWPLLPFAQQLIAVAGEAIGPAADVSPLSRETLDPILEQAVTIWSAAPLSAGQQPALGQIDTHIADLPGATLGQTRGTTITLDVDAAGWGWDVHKGEGQRAKGEEGGGKSCDLLVAITHEIGHVLGFPDEFADDGSDHLMSGWLAPGQTRAITPGEFDRLFARGGEF